MILTGTANTTAACVYFENGLFDAVFGNDSLRGPMAEFASLNRRYATMWPSLVDALHAPNLHALIYQTPKPRPNKNYLLE